MHDYITTSQATRILAAEQTHDNLHVGHDVFAAPTHDEIAGRAYEIYVENGRQEGQCEQNWHQAEYELQPGHRLM
jgi:hypothetical protein